MDFKETFLHVAASYTDVTTASLLWDEIEKQYGAKGRHYHTMQHLEYMFARLLEHKGNIAEWDTLIFSVAYHDIVYSATAKDNEEKSACIAVKRLTQINFPPEKMQRCKEQILATSQHLASADHDTNLFTDADLSILGAPWPAYEAYFKNVRKEYRIYPDFLYNPGRKKAITHFLEMDYIFKTAAFRDRFEAGARANINAELEILTGV